MDSPRWQAILSRVVPQDADDLDPLLGRYDAGARTEGRAIFPVITAALRGETAMKQADAICVGLRAAAERDGTADRAARLLGFASERDVEIVVLAETDVTGYERFGLRVERLAGLTPEERAVCEAQIRRLWNIDLVL